MLDIPSISAVVAAIGVLIGVAFAYLEVRNLVRTRQTDLIMRLYSTFGSKEFQDALDKLRPRKFKDYDDYVKKYGWSDVAEVAILFEGLGVLLHRKLIDVSLVDDLFTGPIERIWEKVKPMVEGFRKQYNQPGAYWFFEYLYNKMQKREQRLQQLQQ